MVCFKYVTVNTVHKRGNTDDVDDDDDNNNNNNNNSHNVRGDSRDTFNSICTAT
jgi:hypothetical protein